MLNLTSSQKFSPAKVSNYSIGDVAASVTTPTFHAHEPLGLLFLATTLEPGLSAIIITNG